jgi:hypothetical protein
VSAKVFEGRKAGDGAHRVGATSDLSNQGVDPLLTVRIARASISADWAAWMKRRGSVRFKARASLPIAQLAQGFIEGNTDRSGKV